MTTESISLASDRQSPNTFADSDNDGVNDGLDAFPTDTTESVDTDGDGIGNNADMTMMETEFLMSMMHFR